MPKTSFTHKALSGQVATFHIDISDPHRWDEDTSAIGKKGRETQAAFDAWQTEYEAISQKVGLASIEEEQDQLCNILALARADAVAAPIRSLTELAEKVDFIKDQFDGDYDADHMDAIIGDVRRLAAMGGL